MDEDEDEAEVGTGRLAIYICYAPKRISLSKWSFLNGGTTMNGQK